MTPPAELVVPAAMTSISEQQSCVEAVWGSQKRERSMTTNIRRGNIPNAPSGVGPYLDEIYTLKGFFGDWAMIYRSQNAGLFT